MVKLLFRFGFITSVVLIAMLILDLVLSSVFKATSVIFPYGLTPFDIYQKNITLWNYIKLSYVVFYFSSALIISNLIFNLFFNKISFEKGLSSKEPLAELSLFIGNNEKQEKITVNEYGLYQNFLISGTTGSGKTSAAMYPLTRQLIEYKHDNISEKIGMLILDVKGNFYKKVKEYAQHFDREDDLIILEIGGKYNYNPLNKPHLKPSVLANRLKIILTLFSENNSDSYWLDKTETALCEAIKLCRLYNNKYVNFTEIHKIITEPGYYKEKIASLKGKFQQNLLSQSEVFDLTTAITFFENEFNSMDSRVLSILKSEITRITNTFINELEVLNTFSPSIDCSNSFNFKDVLSQGKIVVLNVNIATYQNLSKILATYLKLDFQTEVLESLASSPVKTSAFICDEYPQYVTATDADFFSQSREAKCINIVATQSYTSILNSLKNEYATKVIIQNLINKLWFRTDDIFTIEEAQKQIGKENKIRVSRNISENSKNVGFNFLFKALKSDESSFSEGFSTHEHFDYVYDTRFFTQKLETFSCLAFLSNGYEILDPCKLNLIPYFK
ncbi:MAG: hypothetical protein FWF46_07510 [Oscillospiraceae bacterium]|nr:hypothetical protein [Oscillospiraceae bacterium]